jgi:hypothetical protein
MATSRSFGNMLNEYLPNDLMMGEYIKRDWLLNDCDIDYSWKNGPLVVPFYGAEASSISFGELTASGDIAEAETVRGTVSTYAEVWASLVLNQTDLAQHDGKIPETTFLKIVPNQADMLLDKMKQAVSTQMLNGSHFATFTANGTAGGVIAVDHIDRFCLGQKLQIDDNDSAALTVYVIAINIDASTITVSATRGGAAVDVSMYTTAQTARCYHPGVLTNGSFVSLRESLLSAANGGSATLYGVSKLSYPYLQATNISGATWTSATLLANLFDGYNTVRQKGRGNANTIVLSFKHMASVMKAVETQKGAYFVTKQPSASIYGWTEIEITSVKGTLKIVAVQEMDDDVIFYLDKKAYKFYTNGGFKKRKSPEGVEYFEIRGTSGYSYIVDFCCYGQFVVHSPNSCAVAYGISY